MNDYKIPLSSATIRLKLIMTGVFVVIVCSITTFFFRHAVSIAPILQEMFITLLWSGMTLLWAIGAFAAWRKQSKTSYILTDKTLIIRKEGWLGKSAEQLYNYDKIIAVSSTSRAHGSYGSLVITVSQQEPVTISGILLPEEHARRIKKMVNKVSS